MSPRMRAHPLLAPPPSLLALLLALLACDASNPVAPVEGLTPAPATAYTISLSASPPSATASVTETVTITVTVARNDGGTVAAGTSMSVSTSLGTLEADGASGSLLTLTLDSDQKSVVLIPGDEPGMAEVLARVDDSAGSVMVEVEDPGDPPVAAFEAFPSGQTVQFRDMSTGSPTAWYWNFGGVGDADCPATPPGELMPPCTDANPIFTYDAAGNYPVTLTVERFSDVVTTDPSDFRSSFTQLVAVEVPPQAAFATQRRLLSVIFTDMSSGNPTEWEWSFGDDATSDLQNPSHAYEKGGEYPVTLTVRTGAGVSTTSRFVCVNVSLPTEACPETTTSETTGEG
jgi:PKD repeat protein